MQLPALNTRTADYGEALRTGEALKTSRLKNRLLQTQIQKGSALAELRKKIFGADGTVPANRLTVPSNTGSGAVPAAATPGFAGPRPSGGRLSFDFNDPETRKAIGQYMSIADPKDSAAILATIDQGTEIQRKWIAEMNEVRGRAASYVLSQPKEGRALAYATTIAELQSQGIDTSTMPRQYNERAVQRQLAMATPLKTIIDQRNKFAAAQSPEGKLEADLRAGRITKSGYDAGLQRLRKPLSTTEVNVDQRQETEQSKAYGKSVGQFYGERFTTLQKGAETARAQNARLDRADQLLDQTYTGTGAKALVELKKLAKLFNFDLSELPGNVAPAEAAMALTNQMALELRNPASGAGMPGSMSDADREFLMSLVPDLGQTREGRKLLIHATRKINERSIEVAKLARQYAKKNGALDGGFEDELQAFSEKNPLFTKDDFTMREKARLPRVTNDDDFAELAPGTYFIDPEGNPRQKPVQ